MHSVGIKQDVDLNSSASLLAPNSPNYWYVARRYAVCVLIVFLSAMAAYPLGRKLVSQIHHLRAKKFIQQGYNGLASHALQKAAFYQPKDYHIQREWGDVNHQIGKLSPTAKSAYTSAEKAKKRYQEALRLNPLDAQSAYGLARQEDWLEQLFTEINPREHTKPHDALPYYEMAIRLRPNGILYHYALARYLHRKNNVTEMLRIVGVLARIYPLAYYHLKKEYFWSAPVKVACRQGLQEAIKDNISPAAAHMALVDLMVGEKDWTGAIAHYQNALEIQPRRQTDGAYFYLGGLFLKSGDMQAAKANFLKSLALSRTKEKRLESLYRVFKKESVLNEFNEFYQEVQQRFALSVQAGIFLGRSYIDLKQYDQARRIIEELNTDEPTAEAYYWLARIAKNQADWDQMEFAIQRATVLEPDNNHYRQIFFRVLKRMNKFESAETQLDFIINYSDKPSAELYSEKALFRWKQKDYEGALEAWQSAIGVKPDRAAFHAQAAEAYLMLGNWSRAGAFYQKATILDPKNKRYAKRYREIIGNDAES
ncbi:hypothetical protein D1BOALGB6SA_5454 [Olavius sp. associated proteobacterium Delta 1]|nr:hypothetical protein D1BOALGB6SA_5454 [Olavius sp. associated proteobacterium Delta 1]